MAEKIHAINLDAADSVFFARELEYVKTQTYDVVYQNLRYQQFLPISSEVDPGADSITYRSFDQVGMAKIIANYADDLPRVDAKGTEVTSKVRGIGDSYGYNVQEIRAARMAGRRLETRRASVCRRAIEQIMNNLAWLANGEDGLYGLFYNPNVTSGAATTGSWGTATADQILADMMDCVDAPTTLSHGVERVNTLLMPLSKLRLTNKAWRSANSDTTILEFFQKQRPYVTVDYLEECAGLNPKPSGGAGPTDIMVAYDNNPDKLTFEIPQPFEQFPAQPRNLEQVVPCHARSGGTLVYYPVSVNIAEDL
jgi:hypothetical protein